MDTEIRKFLSLVSPYDVRDYEIACATPADLPQEFMLEPTSIKNQGSVGSCVAHACSSIVEYHNRRQEESDIVFSTEFIYGYRPKGYYIGRGMYVRDALKTLSKYGDVPLMELNGNHEYEEAMANVNANFDALKDTAYPHRISSYVRLRTDTSIKTALQKYGCVIVSMPWHTDARLEDNVYTHTNAKIAGYHTVMVYGWNQQGWLVQNSWGKNWGNDGLFILPFDIELVEAWGIIDNIDNDDGDIIKPKENAFMQFIYKIINFFGNLFKKK